uniref:Protein turtle n=1 Tax=Lygus hesperus TaxID=30085 RepID=A0A0A9WQQ3_LYGHE
MGEGRLPLRPFQRSWCRLQEKWNAVFQQSRGEPRRRLHLHAQQRTGDDGPFAADQSDGPAPSSLHGHPSQHVPQEARRHDPHDLRRSRRLHQTHHRLVQDGSPMPSDRTVMNGGNLTISDIKETDQGMYQCVASNEAATISADTELFIETNLPRGPHNLTGEATSNSVSLAWRSGVMINSAQYSVWVRAVPSQEWRMTKVTGSKATIHNLKPGREYEFMVLSQDHDGAGMFSRPFRIFTKGAPIQTHPNLPAENAIEQKGEISIGAPRGVAVTSSIEGFTLSWKPPLTEGTTEIDHYSVTLRESVSEDENEVYEGNNIVQTTQETSLYVGELKDSVIYSIQIRAVTSDSMESPPAEIVLHVPPVTQVAAASLWFAALVGFLLATVIICFYTNRLYVRNQIDILKSRR